MEPKSKELKVLEALDSSHDFGKARGKGVNAMSPPTLQLVSTIKTVPTFAGHAIAHSGTLGAVLSALTSGEVNSVGNATLGNLAKVSKTDHGMGMPSISGRQVSYERRSNAWAEWKLKLEGNLEVAICETNIVTYEQIIKKEVTGNMFMDDVLVLTNGENQPYKWETILKKGSSMDVIPNGASHTRHQARNTLGGFVLNYMFPGYTNEPVGVTYDAAGDKLTTAFGTISQVHALITPQNISDSASSQPHPFRDFKRFGHRRYDVLFPDSSGEIKYKSLLYSEGKLQLWLVNDSFGPNNMTGFKLQIREARAGGASVVIPYNEWEKGVPQGPGAGYLTGLIRAVAAGNVDNAADPLNTTVLKLNSQMKALQRRLGAPVVQGFLFDLKRTGDYEQVNAAKMQAVRSAEKVILGTGDVLCSTYARSQKQPCILQGIGGAGTDTMVIFRFPQASTAANQVLAEKFRLSQQAATIVGAYDDYIWIAGPGRDAAGAQATEAAKVLLNYATNGLYIGAYKKNIIGKSPSDTDYNIATYINMFITGILRMKCKWMLDKFGKEIMAIKEAGDHLKSVTSTHPFLNLGDTTVLQLLREMGKAKWINDPTNTITAWVEHSGGLASMKDHFSQAVDIIQTHVVHATEISQKGLGQLARMGERVAAGAAAGAAAAPRSISELASDIGIAGAGGQPIFKNKINNSFYSLLDYDVAKITTLAKQLFTFFRGIEAKAMSMTRRQSPSDWDRLRSLPGLPSALDGGAKGFNLTKYYGENGSWSFALQRDGGPPVQTDIVEFVVVGIKREWRTWFDGYKAKVTGGGPARDESTKVVAAAMKAKMDVFASKLGKLGEVLGKVPPPPPPPPGQPPPWQLAAAIVAAEVVVPYKVLSSAQAAALAGGGNYRQQSGGGPREEEMRVAEKEFYYRLFEILETISMYASEYLDQNISNISVRLPGSITAAASHTYNIYYQLYIATNNYVNSYRETYNTTTGDYTVEQSGVKQFMRALQNIELMTYYQQLPGAASAIAQLEKITHSATATAADYAGVVVQLRQEAAKAALKLGDPLVQLMKNEVFLENTEAIVETMATIWREGYTLALQDLYNVWGSELDKELGGVEFTLEGVVGVNPGGNIPQFGRGPARPGSSFTYVQNVISSVLGGALNVSAVEQVIGFAKLYNILNHNFFPFNIVSFYNMVDNPLNNRKEAVLVSSSVHGVSYIQVSLPKVLKGGADGPQNPGWWGGGFHRITEQSPNVPSSATEEMSRLGSVRATNLIYGRTPVFSPTPTPDTSAAFQSEKQKLLALFQQKEEGLRRTRQLDQNTERLKQQFVDQTELLNQQFAEQLYHQQQQQQQENLAATMNAWLQTVGPPVQLGPYMFSGTGCQKGIGQTAAAWKALPTPCSLPPRMGQSASAPVPVQQQQQQMYQQMYQQLLPQQQQQVSRMPDEQRQAYMQQLLQMYQQLLSQPQQQQQVSMMSSDAQRQAYMQHLLQQVSNHMGIMGGGHKRLHTRKRKRRRRKTKRRVRRKQSRKRKRRKRKLTRRKQRKKRKKRRRRHKRRYKRGTTRKRFR